MIFQGFFYEQCDFWEVEVKMSTGHWLTQEGGKRALAFQKLNIIYDADHLIYSRPNEGIQLNCGSS